MSVSIQTGDAAPRTYGNLTRPKTAGLLGLGSIGTGILFAGAVLTVLMVMCSTLFVAFLTALVFAVFLMAVTIKAKPGRARSPVLRLVWAGGTLAERVEFLPFGPARPC